MIENSAPLVVMGNPAANMSQSTQTNRLSEFEHDLQLREVPKPVISSGVQTRKIPSDSMPSRRNSLMSARHTQVRPTDEERREKHDGNFKLSRKFIKKEISTTSSATNNNVTADRAKPNVAVASDDDDDSLRYSSPSVSHSPTSGRKRRTEMYIASTQRSPTHSQMHGCPSSDTSSNIHSSPAHRHTCSDARRASSPGLTATVHMQKPHGYPILSHRKSKHLAYPLQQPTYSSSNSDSQEGYHEGARHFIPGRSSGCVKCACMTCDDRTPPAHMVTKAKDGAIRERESSEIFHCSEPDTSPEHHDAHILGHSRPRLVKVIKTPQLKKKRVVCLASSSTPSSEEVYYSEPGHLVMSKSRNQRRRVVGNARGASGNKRSRNRDDELREIHVRGDRQRKVYVKPAKPKKRVYIVEQSSGESESDLDQFEVNLTQGSSSLELGLEPGSFPPRVNHSFMHGSSMGQKDFGHVLDIGDVSCTWFECPTRNQNLLGSLPLSYLPCKIISHKEGES